MAVHWEVPCDQAKLGSGPSCSWAPGAARCPVLGAGGLLSSTIPGRALPFCPP